MDTNLTYLIRVWLPDRPGALGLVASRLGALRGDVVGLEIIERGGGMAVDELVVSLPAEVPIDALVKEVRAEEGVDVEDVFLLADSTYDPQLDMLEVAALVLQADTRDSLAKALTEHVCRAARSAWACVVEPDGRVLASHGDRPNSRWLESFMAGSPQADAEQLDELSAVEAVWLPLPMASVAVVVGGQSPIRSKERQRLTALAKIADTWFHRLETKPSYANDTSGDPQTVAG